MGDRKALDLKENCSGGGAQAGRFPLKTKKPARSGLFVGKSSLSGGLRCLVHPVGSTEGAEIIEPYAIFPEHFMGLFGGHLPYIEGVADYEVVNRVGAAEVEAQGLHRPQPPYVQYLALFGDFSLLIIAVVVHVGRNKVQAKCA